MHAHKFGYWEAKSYLVVGYTSSNFKTNSDGVHSENSIMNWTESAVKKTYLNLLSSFWTIVVSK